MAEEIRRLWTSNYRKSIDKLKIVRLKRDRLSSRVGRDFDLIWNSTFLEATGLLVCNVIRLPTGSGKNISYWRGKGWLTPFLKQTDSSFAKWVGNVNTDAKESFPIWFVLWSYSGHISQSILLQLFDILFLLSSNLSHSLFNNIIYGLLRFTKQTLNSFICT